MIKLDKCPVCDKEQWKPLDYLRDVEYWYALDERELGESVGFKICKYCGFVTYDYVPEERLKERYRAQRKVMKFGNILSCNIKNNYHRDFLAGKIKPGSTVIDIGCAQGAFLGLVKEMVQDAYLYGTEWSTAFRAFAENEYGVITYEDIPEDKEFDFVSCYKVFEHMQYPIENLAKMRAILKDDGLLYISVPVHFEEFDHSDGSPIQSFENLYHTNHVNVFSRVSFKNMLKKVGFKVVEENDTMYGLTCLCVKCELSGHIEIENYQDIESVLVAQKAAFEALARGDHLGAIGIYPKFPDAYIMLSMGKDNVKNFEKQTGILKQALELTPNSAKLLMQLAKAYFQWDESTPDKGEFYSNNIKKAEQIIDYAFSVKPGHDEMYYFKGLIEGKYKKNYNTAVAYLKKCIEVNPLKFAECWNLISYFWNEKGSNHGKGKNENVMEAGAERE